MFGVESKIRDLRDLEKPNTIFISEDFSKMYFRDQDPVGKQIHIEALQYAGDLGFYATRGIVRNSNPRTHFKYALLISQEGGLQERYESLAERKIQWTYNYYRLGEGMDPALIAGIIICLLGISAMVLFIARQRTREIVIEAPLGIRWRRRGTNENIL